MLPSKAQRDEAEQNRLQRERDYEARKAADAFADKLKHEAKREEFIVTAVNEVRRNVLRAVEYRNNFIYVRCSENENLREWTEDSTYIADEIYGRLLSLSDPEYKFERVIEDASYEESSITADGGPGEGFWHTRHFPAIKISWE